MSKQRSLRMEDRFDRFIEDRIASDDYETAEEVVQAGLELLAEREIALEQIRQGFDRRSGKPWTPDSLRAAIRKGEESGEAVEIDFERLFEDVCAEVDAEEKGSGAS